MASGINSGSLQAQLAVAVQQANAAVLEVNSSWLETVRDVSQCGEQGKKLVVALEMLKEIDKFQRAHIQAQIKGPLTDAEGAKLNKQTILVWSNMVERLHHTIDQQPSSLKKHLLNLTFKYEKLVSRLQSLQGLIREVTERTKEAKQAQQEQTDYELALRLSRER